MSAAADPMSAQRVVVAPLRVIATNLQCTTAVLLKGWPEEPYLPPAAFATLSIDAGETALIFTAVQDIVPAPPASPGSSSSVCFFKA
jgi:hypothetical protein